MEQPGGSPPSAPTTRSHAYAFGRIGNTGAPLRWCEAPGAGKPSSLTRRPGSRASWTRERRPAGCRTKPSPRRRIPWPDESASLQPPGKGGLHEPHTFVAPPRGGDRQVPGRGRGTRQAGHDSIRRAGTAPPVTSGRGSSGRLEFRCPACDGPCAAPSSTHAVARDPHGCARQGKSTPRGGDRLRGSPRVDRTGLAVAGGRRGRAMVPDAGRPFRGGAAAERGGGCGFRPRHRGCGSRRGEHLDDRDHRGGVSEAVHMPARCRCAPHRGPGDGSGRAASRSL